MSPPLQPTTRAQVSGHRFLRRRVEHGLVFGDIRMIHDPLRARFRGLIFGTIAVALGLMGAGLFAWLNPQPDPGDAVILRSSSGMLYVRIDDRVHAVSNLASARLIAGTPAEPVSIGDDFLAAADKGVPLGIDPAPGQFAPTALAAGEDRPAPQWAACTTAAGAITVLADGAEVTPTALGPDHAVLIDGPTSQWVATSAGRRELPAADTAEGRVLRRVLGITADTPRLAAPAEILTATAELPPWRVPAPLPALWDTGSGRWAHTDDDRVVRLTDTQAEALRALGAPAITIAPTRLAQHADAIPLALPERPQEFLDPAGTQVCASTSGEVRLLTQEEIPGTVELAGSSPAERFGGLAAGAVLVDTGAGHHVVGTAGLRHEVDAAARESLGLGAALPLSWEVVGLLPEGPPLTSSDARKSRY